MATDMPTEMPTAAVRLLTSPDDTDALGREIALWLGAGDFVALIGPLGAGKTVLARAIVNALSPSPQEVTSPTFTLVQHYEKARVPVWHFDLYRVAGIDDLDELGLADALDTGLALVEWADRMEPALPADRLEVRLDEAADGRREARLSGHGSWQDRLSRALDLSAFLRKAGWSGATRTWLKGDASARSYERIADRSRARHAIVMNAPHAADGPPVRDGKPYSRIAHLAEDVTSFVAVDRFLEGLGLSVPRIHESDLERGFLILEDLGDRLYGGLIAQGRDLESAYGAAVDVLCVLHEALPPAVLPVEDGRVHRVASYDLAAMMIEVELLIDWAWPATNGGPCPHALRSEYCGLWEEALSRLAGPQVLVLRDYHSPNLLWLPQRQGVRRAGLIDFQDAVIGHPAYDLVSLAQDARIDMPEGLERFVIERWLAACPARVSSLSADAFAADYALLGAQRAAKIVGIFCRLAMRDGKPGYLAHLGRVAGYLRRDLGHPTLSPLAAWFLEHFDLGRDLSDLARNEQWG